MNEEQKLLKTIRYLLIFGFTFFVCYVIFAIWFAFFYI